MSTHAEPAHDRTPRPHGTPAATGHDPRLAVAEALEHAAHYLPAQGPIGVFIHHNTLHAFQHLPFHDALAQASALFGNEGYLRESQFRAHFRDGRIDDADLDASLAGRDAAHGERTIGPVPLRALDRLLLKHPIEAVTAQRLKWLLNERDAGRRYRADLDPRTKARALERSVDALRAWLSRDDDHLAELCTEIGEALDTRVDRDVLAKLLADDPEAAAVALLWGVCRDTTARAHLPADPGYRNHREHLLDVIGEDANDLVNPVLVRLSNAFLDTGVATWPMPDRHDGFYRAFRTLVLTGAAPLPGWLDGLGEELRQAQARDLDAATSVVEALDELGVPPSEWEPYVTRKLLGLPGWAGMFHWLEGNPTEQPPNTRVKLVDFLALRLLLTRYALRHLAREHLGYAGPLRGLSAAIAQRMQESGRARKTWLDEADRAAHEAAWQLFHLAQLAGLSFADVQAMGMKERVGLLDHAATFDDRKRRRVWQEAYEAHYRRDVARGIAQNMKRPRSARAVTEPKLQFVCCFDDREESFRRHIEEQDPRFETFGAAGFFGMAMDFLGLDDGRLAPLCPVVVTPQHAVLEEPVEAERDVAEARLRRRRAWARIVHEAGIANRSFFRGSLLGPVMGFMAAFPMAFRILFPREAELLRSALEDLALPRPNTRLVSTRVADERHEMGKLRGFAIKDATDRVATTLENLGLVDRFAPLVVVLGHGSTTTNNPHRSAYDCGACGGRHGGPNARLFAEMANRPDVRAGLRERGIAIPDGTWFIGGEHDTTTDKVFLADLDKVPAELAPQLALMHATFERARRMSAHERCRRFESAPRDPTPEQALRHVEGRAVDLGQARPELGHVTNASAVFGRRELTKGLFLDRRCFVVSYDPTIDESGKILERLLLAAGPVGAGINLEYYFSCVDNERYGCGTKLPHNVAGLLGVMEGTASDLRTGLPKQMIEIHEPVRLQVFVEAPLERVAAIYARQPPLQELIGNEWIHVVVVDPATGGMQLFTPNGFVPLTPPADPLPVVSASVEWYRGRTSFVPPALVVPASEKEAAHGR